MIGMRFLFILLITVFATISLVSASDKTRVEELLQVQYLPINYNAMANMEWKFNTLNVGNYSAIEDYIAITNCPLYSRYYTNDFLWQRIKEGVKRQLGYYAPQFTDRYEIISAIDLGRYDFQKAAFILPEDSQLRNVAYFTLGRINSLGTVCDRDIKEFPVIFSAVMNTPINLDNVPVTTEIAKSIIEKNNNSSNPNKRMAVMRLRLKILDILPDEKSSAALYTETKFRTEVDEIAIFENTRSNTPLWEINFKDLKR